MSHLPFVMPRGVRLTRSRSDGILAATAMELAAQAPRGLCRG